MSQNQKTLKIASLLLWILSLVSIVSAVHVFFYGIVNLLSVFLLVDGLFGFFAGWLGIQGSNTPSKIDLLPKLSLAVILATVAYLVTIQFLYMATDVHGTVAASIVALIVAVDYVVCFIYSRKVASQVAL